MLDCSPGMSLGPLGSEVPCLLHTFGWHLPEVLLGGFAEAVVEGMGWTEVPLDVLFYLISCLIYLDVFNICIYISHIIGIIYTYISLYLDICIYIYILTGCPCLHLRSEILWLSWSNLARQEQREASGRNVEELNVGGGEVGLASGHQT